MCDRLNVDWDVTVWALHIFWLHQYTWHAGTCVSYRGRQDEQQGIMGRRWHSRAHTQRRRQSKASTRPVTHLGADRDTYKRPANHQKCPADEDFALVFRCHGSKWFNEQRGGRGGSGERTEGPDSQLNLTLKSRRITLHCSAKQTHTKFGKVCVYTASHLCLPAICIY